MWRCRICETYNEDNANFCMVCGEKRPEAHVRQMADDRQASRNEPLHSGNGAQNTADIRQPAAERRRTEDTATRKSDAGHEAPKRAPKKKGGNGKWLLLALAALLVIAVVFAYAFSRPYLPAEGEVPVLNSYDVPLLAGPGEDYITLDMLDPGDVLNYNDAYTLNSKAWFFVNANGISGWVCGDDLDWVNKNQAPQATAEADMYAYVTGDFATVYDGPGYDYEILDTMGYGDKAVYLDENAQNEFGLWYKIEYNGITGWANRRYVELDR